MRASYSSIYESVGNHASFLNIDLQYWYEHRNYKKSSMFGIYVGLSID